MLEPIWIIISGICFVICLTISVVQFKGKGFLFNNAYILKSKQERRKMNKKPHYKQSGIVLPYARLYFYSLAWNVFLRLDGCGYV